MMPAAWRRLPCLAAPCLAASGGARSHGAGPTGTVDPKKWGFVALGARPTKGRNSVRGDDAPRNLEGHGREGCATRGSLRLRAAWRCVRAVCGVSHHGVCISTVHGRLCVVMQAPLFLQAPRAMRVPITTRWGLSGSQLTAQRRSRGRRWRWRRIHRRLGQIHRRRRRQ